MDVAVGDGRSATNSGARSTVNEMSLRILVPDLVYFVAVRLYSPVLMSIELKGRI